MAACCRGAGARELRVGVATAVGDGGGQVGGQGLVVHGAGVGVSVGARERDRGAGEFGLGAAYAEVVDEVVTGLDESLHLKLDRSSH